MVISVVKLTPPLRREIKSPKSHDLGLFIVRHLGNYNS